MSIFSSIGDFIGSNSNWLKPVLNLGSNILGQSQRKSNMDDYLDSLRAAEQRNYDQAKLEHDAYADWAEGAAAARNAAAASSASAARANEASRVNAAKKGLKTEKKAFQTIKGIYEPFANTSKELLPVMTGAYRQGVDNLSMLNAFMTNPAKMNNSIPAYAINAPLPEYARTK